MRQALPAPDIRVSTQDMLPDSVTEYARSKIGVLLRRIGRPVLSATVRITNRHNPSVKAYVTAQANLDIEGQVVCARVAATTATEAIDLLEAKLARRLEHDGRRREARRSRPTGAGDHPVARPRDASQDDEPRVARHKSFALSRCGCDTAADLMDAMDYDFHLFTEVGSGQDSVVYRGGETGYRLAQVCPEPGSVVRGDLELTVSETPAPLLAVGHAIERLELTGQPFTFFVDTATARGCVLYRRHDNQYGLVTPNG
jgi:ribosome-associated translation inhibitor RaiA